MFSDFGVGLFTVVFWISCWYGVVIDGWCVGGYGQYVLALLWLVCVNCYCVLVNVLDCGFKW